MVTSLIAGFLVLKSGSSAGQPLPKTGLSGHWIPVDSTWEFSRLDVYPGKGGWVVHVYAKATFDEIDWGEAPLELFGEGVEAKRFDHGLATYSEDFGSEHLTIGVKNGRLELRVYTTFTDGSGRTNYASEVHFRKSART